MSDRSAAACGEPRRSRCGPRASGILLAATLLYAALATSLAATPGDGGTRRAAVANKLQGSALVEPARNAARWHGEAGVSVALGSGEVIVQAVDRFYPGRAGGFAIDRTYRSGTLGYGPLGAAGWSSSLFMRLSENTITGEVALHAGDGRVWRFVPRGEALPPGVEDDPLGSYAVPAGLDLRLVKVPLGWRLLGRHHDSALFDSLGRLVERADRHVRPGDGERGNRLRFSYDVFGQLVVVEDELGRRYRFEYHASPREPEYGLLWKITDFADRTIEYEWNALRQLVRVRLPEVANETATYGDFSHVGEERPTVRYAYEQPITSLSAPLHGPLGLHRLTAVFLPSFVAGGADVPRVRIAYDPETARVAAVSYPDRSNAHPSGAGVRWRFALLSGTVPATVRVTTPWAHAVDYELENGRAVAIREELEVRRGGAAPVSERLGPDFTYAGDGRLTSVTYPDGLRESVCYADAGGPACPPSEGDPPERLQRPNALTWIREATTEASRGAAEYDRISTAATYQIDNLVSQVTDGLGRSIELPVGEAGSTTRLLFGAEAIGSRFELDSFGRVKRSAGGLGSKADGEPLSIRTVVFGKDSRGRESAGLPQRITEGEGAGKLWTELRYDEAWNVERIETSQGTTIDRILDSWDREVRSVSGKADGRLRPLGVAGCSEGDGAIVERAFDAAGHLVRERRLQDFADEQGVLACRWVETQYRYNAREQLVEVGQSHLADPTQAGELRAAVAAVQRFEFDAHGRLEKLVSLNVVSEPLETVFRYDAAGRLAGVRAGDEGERTQGYDERSRAVVVTDGDDGEHRRRFDAWGRLYREEPPTGAIVDRRFDEADHLTEERVWDRDPTLPGATLLSEVKTHFTSFGQPDRVIQLLDDDGEMKVVERDFDESGREVAIWSGPALGPNDELLDPTRARRDVERRYEPETERVLEELYGGLRGQDGLFRDRFHYLADNRSPWPDVVERLESVPGRSELVAAARAEIVRDAAGRPVFEKWNTGRSLESIYDRASQAVIETRDGAGTTTTRSLDGRGMPLRTIRPHGRGQTIYAHDLDGRRLREIAATAGGDGWERSYAYDRTGRVVRIDHEDGTTESLTYDSDSTIAARTTRDGVRVAYRYDVANRLLAAVPSATDPLPASLVALDAGDATEYDLLSRVTAARRGRSGVVGFDSSLFVAYPAYDLGSRPAAEVVGGRAPLTWDYDTWSRPTTLALPAGVTALAGFDRSFDSLDRLAEVTGAGGSAGVSAGATLAWGGESRLYGVTTKGALGTAARYGYVGGPGLQPSGGDAALWQLGTVSWGFESGDPIATATSAPAARLGVFELGWRGHEGDPRDGMKVGRAASGALGGLGWAYGYDASVRLASAELGAGDLSGHTRADAVERWTYAYGKGDELQRIARATGEVATFESGANGRITSRDGVAFGYDASGRRREDDRFAYRWNWRGELAEVTVKNAWPEGAPPYAGHQIRFEFDARGRLTERYHYGSAPTEVEARPLLERRDYLWEGQSLLGEIGYNDEAGNEVRWKKTYVPGPSGLDDALQVVVEIPASFPGSPYAGTTRLYTFLRDEMGTVVGLVDEQDGNVPVRYVYSPYGEAHAELGPELRAASFQNAGENGTQVVVAGTIVEQAVADPIAAAPGALRIEWSLPLAEPSLAAAIVVERSEGSAWSPIDATELLIGFAPNRPEHLLVACQGGWPRGVTYRVRVLAGLQDLTARPFDGNEAFEFLVPAPTIDTPAPAVRYRKTFPLLFDSALAAAGTVDGRFPGGQSQLFQGLTTDPVAGLSYARARWYDARNAAWLSEDAFGEIDSTNLYAFVGWAPAMGRDPFGTCWQAGAFGLVQCAARALSGDEAMEDVAVAAAKGAAVAVGKEVAATAVEELSPVGIANGLSGAVLGHDFVRDEPVEGVVDRGLSLAGAAPGAPSSIRHLGDVGDAARQFDNLGDAVREVGGVGRRADDVGGAARMADDLPSGPHGGGEPPGGGGPSGGGGGGPSAGSEGPFLPDEYYDRMQNKRAPGQSSPYSRHERFDAEGNLEQVTTYDEFGDRAVQYDVGPDARHGEGYHTFEFDADNPRQAPGGGRRSPHKPLNAQR